MTLISQQAVLQAEGEAARKQAESATQAAQTMLDEASKESSKSKEDVDNLVRGLLVLFLVRMFQERKHPGLFPGLSTPVPLMWNIGLCTFKMLLAVPVPPPPKS